MPNIDSKAVWPGWTTVRLIGRGSYGAVYEIERDVLGEKEKAALKVITIPQSESDIKEMYSDGYDEESITSTFRDHLKSIVAEYSLMRKLNGSSNIVNCDDVRYVQHDDGIGWDIFIKMELLTPLTDALPAEVTEKQVVRIAKDLSHALVQCRQFDIVHRDIKPQNIFVSPLGDYKLGDFGIAKTVERTSGGTKIGTYKYMAPEVYNNQPYGAGADIYSLGLVLYWMLNERRMPFLPLPPEKLRAGMEEQARLRRFNGETIPAPAHGSEALKRIVLKACAYDPKDRYQNADEMLRDLEKLDAPAADVITSASIPRPAAQDSEEDGTVGIFSHPSAAAEIASESAEKPEDGTIGVFSCKTPVVEAAPGQETNPEDGTVGMFFSSKVTPAGKDDSKQGTPTAACPEPEPAVEDAAPKDAASLAASGSAKREEAQRKAERQSVPEVRRERTDDAPGFKTDKPNANKAQGQPGAKASANDSAPQEAPAKKSPGRSQKRLWILISAGVAALALVLILVFSPKTVASGACGENLSWKLDRSGVLTISGSGKMTNYTSENATPWKDLRADIRQIQVEAGVKSIGTNAFSGCVHLENVTIGSDVIFIDVKAFMGCSHLQSITIPLSLKTVGTYAFSGCASLKTVYYPGTTDQFNSITIGSGNETFSNAFGNG